MKIIPITTNNKNTASQHIFSPVLDGLNAEQADCASVIPSGNANKILFDQLSRGSRGVHSEVGLFCNDPFINNKTIFPELHELGVRSVVNWPSCIFFEQNFRKVMGDVSVSPKNEFECLANAMSAGLQARAMVLSLNQAKQALSLGIRCLIIHPGLKLEHNKVTQDAFFESIHLMIDTLISIEPSVEVYLYQHSIDEVEAHMAKYKGLINISGYVVYKASLCQK